MKLELAILAGDESKRFLVEFKQALDRLEKLVEPLLSDDEDDVADEPPVKAKSEKKNKKASKKQPPIEDDFSVEDVEDEDDEDDVEDVEDEDDEDDIEDEDDAAPKKRGRGRPKKADATKKKTVKKSTRTKKLTVDDCNDAAKALAKAVGGTKGRPAVLAIMKNVFNVKSVSELKPDQYEEFIAEMHEAKAEHEGDE